MGLRWFKSRLKRKNLVGWGWGWGWGWVGWGWGGWGGVSKTDEPASDIVFGSF